jgi:hypothetical protein
LEDDLAKKLASRPDAKSLIKEHILSGKLSLFEFIAYTSRGRRPNQNPQGISELANEFYVFEI